MLNLDQVRLLEQKVEQVVTRIKTLSQENAILKNQLNSVNAQNKELVSRNQELKTTVSSFKEDQGRIEEGILSALSRLNEFEDVALGRKDSYQDNLSNNLEQNSNSELTNNSELSNTSEQNQQTFSSQDKQSYSKTAPVEQTREERPLSSDSFFDDTNQPENDLNSSTDNSNSDSNIDVTNNKNEELDANLDVDTQLEIF